MEEVVLTVCTSTIPSTFVIDALKFLCIESCIPVPSRITYLPICTEMQYIWCITHVCEYYILWIPGMNLHLMTVRRATCDNSDSQPHVLLGICGTSSVSPGRLVLSLNAYWVWRVVIYCHQVKVHIMRWTRWKRIQLMMCTFMWWQWITIRRTQYAFRLKTSLPGMTGLVPQMPSNTCYKV